MLTVQQAYENIAVLLELNLFPSPQTITTSNILTEAEYTDSLELLYIGDMALLTEEAYKQYRDPNYQVDFQKLQNRFHRNRWLEV